MKSKMVARGKFKSRNLFRLLLLLNVTFPLSSKICNFRDYLEQLSVNSRQQPRFPLNHLFYLRFTKEISKNGRIHVFRKHIGMQGVQELFFVNKKPLAVLNNACQSILLLVWSVKSDWLV